MFTKQSAFTENRLVRFVVRQLPYGPKRQMLLASLIATVINVKVPEKELIQDMNDTLRLSHNDQKSIEFPIRVKRAIWRNEQIFSSEFETLLNDTTEQEKLAASLRIASLIPNWLAYDKVEVIAKDITKYFQSRKFRCDTLGLC